MGSPRVSDLLPTVQRHTWVSLTKIKAVLAVGVNVVCDPELCQQKETDEMIILLIQKNRIIYCSLKR